MISLLLALALLLALWMVPAGAASLSFVAVNDTIPLTLSGDELPFYSGGALYVPYTVFSASSLGFYPSYNAGDQLLTLFSRSERLVFDLSAGTVTDEAKNTYYAAAVSRGGLVFLPAAFCANHFGVQVSALSSRSGYQVVRFTTGSQVYDDGLFIEKAENLISYRVSQYLTPAEPPTPESPPQPPQTPSAPAVTTPVIPAQPPDEPAEPEVPPAQVSLAVEGTAGAEAALEALDGAQVQAVFYLSAEEIAADEALVRRIAAAGHLLGVSGPDGEALRRANDALDHALKRKTLLAMTPADAAAEALAAQYRLIPRPETPMTAQDAARAHGQRCLLICPAAAVPEALAILQEGGAALSLLTETGEIPALS